MKQRCRSAGWRQGQVIERVLWYTHIQQHAAVIVTVITDRKTIEIWQMTFSDCRVVRTLRMTNDVKTLWSFWVFFKNEDHLSGTRATVFGTINIAVLSCRFLFDSFVLICQWYHLFVIGSDLVVFVAEICGSSFPIKKFRALHC